MNAGYSPSTWMRNRGTLKLFHGNRYQIVDTPTRLKRNNVTITDIDAAILDKTTGELALFQLKWQDFGSNLLRKDQEQGKKLR